MVRKKSPEQIENERVKRLQSTVSDPLEVFAKAASQEFSEQQTDNIQGTIYQQDDNTVETSSQQTDNISSSSKRPPKETHLHVVMHPDIKAALKKLANADRRKMAEIARDFIVNGLRQKGIEL